MASNPGTRTVDELSERYVEQACALSPTTATYIGVPGHEHELPDLSPGGFAAREELDRRTLAAVTRAEPVDERERVARAAFCERVGLDVEVVDAGLSRAHLSVIDSPLHDVRMVFDLMATETDDDWEQVGARLAAVPDTLAGYRATLREEAGRGHVVARRQYAEVAGQLRSWTGQEGGSGDVFAALAARGPEHLQDRLRASADAAAAAYAETAAFLDERMVPLGREREAVGRDHYALASRQYLGAEVDLEETYGWGWSELRRLADDIEATAARIAPGGLAGALAHLAADPAYTIEGRDAFRDWMQTLADRTVAELADTHFDIPAEIRRIECCLAPTNDGGIYYTGPSEDLRRPGRMWWSVPDGIDSFATWSQVTTVFHEGVPGHHLQVAQTVLRSDLLNRWQRLMCWVSGSGEGWALYAERLMDELGHLSDPADRLGMLDAQSFRAARVIVDIGMHLELEIPRDNPFGFHPGETWTPALGREFMGQHSQDEPAVIDFEVKRYLGWPGQAPSYKVGERIWLEARAAAQERHGDAFDLKAFHRAALDLGSIGLDPLREALARI